MRTFFVVLFLSACCGLWSQTLKRVAPPQVDMDNAQMSYADQAILQAIEEGEIPGAVLAVVRHGKVGYLKAYGNRQLLPTVEPMELNTLFDMASVSKLVSTAVSVMILVEQGKIRLSDPVTLFIPSFQGRKDEEGRDKAILLLDLITHTSGLPPYAPVNQLVQEVGAPNPDGLIDYIATVPRSVVPKRGERDYRYSCLNYIVLQRIVELVSGMSLDAFAKKQIFDPLGMTNTVYKPKGEQERRTAPTTIEPDGKMLKGVVHDPLARVMNDGISGNAGLFSDVYDLTIFAAALLNEGAYEQRRILSPQGVKMLRGLFNEFFAPWQPENRRLFNPSPHIGGELLGETLYGHTGYTGTSLMIVPESDLAIILLTNRVHPKDEGSVVRLRGLVANVVAASLVPPERRYTEHYYRRLLAFEEEPPIGDKEIVMLGNSLTEHGGDWAARVKKKGVRNRGISGDEAMGVVDRLHQILPGKPAKIMLLIGTNDLSHHIGVDSVVLLVERVVKKIRSESPQTKLYLQSLLPINESLSTYQTMVGKTDDIPAINRKLKELAKAEKITFIDLFPLFTEKGSHTLRPSLTSDGLHLTEEGYRIWSKALKRHL